MKTITLTVAALCVCVSGVAQTINLNFDPLNSSLRTSLPPIVNLGCLLLLVAGLATVGWKFNKEQDQMIAGFIVVFFVVVVLWAGLRIGMSAFL